MSYYSEVGHYYDKDAVDFERRYHLNPALQRIRQSFRERVKSHPQSTVLEVGFGPGFDLVHFAEQFPEQQYYGIDISEEMVRLTQDKIDNGKFINAQVAHGRTSFNKSVPKLNEASRGSSHIDFTLDVLPQFGLYAVHKGTLIIVV